MRRPARVWLAVAALLPATWLPAAAAAAGSSAGSEALSLRVELDPGPFTVGDRIGARLEVAGPADRFAGEPVFPAWEASWGEAELLDVEPAARVTAEGGAGDTDLYFRQSLVLTAFRTGEIELPAVSVRVPGSAGEVELTTPADLAFTVESVLPAGDAEEVELEPPEPPRPLPWGLGFWVTAALLATACAAALALAALRRPAAGDPQAAPIPPLEPLEELRRALVAARQATSPRTGHAVLSLALRRYLGRALGFPAVESSTTEIRRRLAVRSLPAAAARRAVTTLTGCDLVKFALQPAPAEELAARAETALSAAAEIDSYLAALRAEAEASPAAATPSPAPRSEAA